MSEAETPTPGTGLPASGLPGSGLPGSGPGGPAIGADASSWDECYEHALPYWDIGECSPPLLAFLSEGILPAPGVVLLPGCGTGHELPVLERAGHSPIGIDFAPRAIVAAEERIRAESLEHSRVVHGDVTSEALDIVPGSIDWAFDQTCFCALAPILRDAYARNLARLLRPGGEVWALNMRTSFTDRPPYDASPEEFQQILERAGFELLEGRKLDEESLERRRGRESLLRFRRS